MSDVDIGTGQAVGALDIRVGNAINLAQVVKCITMLDNVDDPSARRTARDRGLGGHGWKVNYQARQQAGRRQTVGLADLGAGFLNP